MLSHHTSYLCTCCIYIYIYIYIYIRNSQPSCGKAHWYKYQEVGSLTSGQLRSGQFRPSCRQITLWADNALSVSYLPTTRLDRLYIYNVILSH